MLNSSSTSCFWGLWISLAICHPDSHVDFSLVRILVLRSRMFPVVLVGNLLLTPLKTLRKAARVRRRKGVCGSGSGASAKGASSTSLTP